MVEAMRKTWICLGGALLGLVLALLLSWTAERRAQAVIESHQARSLDESAKVLDSFLAHQRKLLAATVGVLSDDARIRAMVLTPTFDRATVVDLLTDLKATSGASVAAMLDGSGVVRAVVGAPEMDQLDLGSSSLVKEAMERPAAGLWAFANEVGVLAAAAVRLDQQVHALFMLGFALEDALLQDIQQALGVTAAVFVGDGIVASASKDPEVERALRLAVELPPGAHQVVADEFVGSSSRLSGAAAAARVAWLLPLKDGSQADPLARVLPWLPALLVALVVGLMLALELSRPRQTLHPSG